jgi:hypothetical protein
VRKIEGGNDCDRDWLVVTKAWVRRLANAIDCDKRLDCDHSGMDMVLAEETLSGSMSNMSFIVAA